MPIELATNLTYFTLGLSFLILCLTLWILNKARQHLSGVKKLAQPWWTTEHQDTLILPKGYHEGY